MANSNKVRPLTPNEKLLVRMVFGQGLTPTAAASEIYNTKYPEVLGAQIMKRCCVQNDIRKQLDEYGLTDRALALLMINQLFATKKVWDAKKKEYEEIPDNTIRDRAIDRLIKIKGLMGAPEKLSEGYRLSAGDQVSEAVEANNLKTAENFKDFKVVG